MKAKRLTALALAALMTASGTSVAFAETPTKDKPLTFYDGAIGEQLYMMDEDGYIVAANNGDFAPGDDIYLALQDYDAASKRELDRINAYEFLDIGDKWVDDIDVVYKKGKWIEQVAQTKEYNINVTDLDIKAFNGVTFSTNKTESSTLVSLAKQALETKRTEAEKEVFSSYTEGSDSGYVYNGKTFDSKEQVLEEAVAQKVYDYVSEYYKVDGTVKRDISNLQKATTGVGFTKDGKYFADKAELIADSGWTLYNPDVHGDLYVAAQPGGYGAVQSDKGSLTTTLATYISTNGVDSTKVYLDKADSSATKYVIIGKVSDEKLANHISGYNVNNSDIYYTDSSPDGQKTIHTINHVETCTNGYFKSGTDELVGDENTAFDALKVTSSSEKYYLVNGVKMTEAEARQAAKNTVTNAINSITADKVYTTSAYAGSPTGSYDGYVWNSGFAYWVKISTEKSTSTKEFDLVGEIGVGSTKSKAEDNTVFLDVTLTNRNWNEDSFENVDSDAYIEPGQRAVLSFADDADDVVIEFGDDAWYEFNARGQGRVNFAYNTNFDRDFAYDYDHANIDFINFVAEPTTNKTGTLYIYADEDSYIYEVTSKGAKKINGAYYDDDEGAWVIRTRHLTSYAISDRRLKTIDQMEDDKNSSSSSKPSGSQGSGSGNGNYKPIPDTGR